MIIAVLKAALLPRLQDLKPMRPGGRPRWSGPKSDSLALAKKYRDWRDWRNCPRLGRELSRNINNLRMGRGLLF
jgi:hypothetical protein